MKQHLAYMVDAVISMVNQLCKKILKQYLPPELQPCNPCPESSTRFFPHLTKDLQETPDPQPAQGRDCEVVIPPEQVNDLARRGN